MLKVNILGRTALAIPNNIRWCHYLRMRNEDPCENVDVYFWQLQIWFICKLKRYTYSSASRLLHKSLFQHIIYMQSNRTDWDLISDTEWQCQWWIVFFFLLGLVLVSVFPSLFSASGAFLMPIRPSSIFHLKAWFLKNCLITFVRPMSNTAHLLILIAINAINYVM